MYVKIIDRGECFSTTMEFINGVYANKTEWAKHNFYPQNGMVGEVVKRTPRAYIIKISDDIYVPMTPKGIKEITYNEYVSNRHNNVCSGMDTRQKDINKYFKGDTWKQLPDMREHFKQDIIENMKKLTCDFERNIYLPDLEQSCLIYAVDMILEYKKQWGERTELPPHVIDEISGQVTDVYQDFFYPQFSETSILRCKDQISEMVKNPNARTIIDDYYHQVNMRYSWH